MLLTTEQMKRFTTEELQRYLDVISETRHNLSGLSKSSLFEFVSPCSYVMKGCDGQLELIGFEIKEEIKTRQGNLINPQVNLHLLREFSNKHNLIAIIDQSCLGAANLAVDSLRQQGIYPITTVCSTMFEGDNLRAVMCPIVSISGMSVLFISTMLNDYHKCDIINSLSKYNPSGVSFLFV